MKGYDFSHESAPRRVDGREYEALLCMHMRCIYDSRIFLPKPGSGGTIILIYDTHGTPMRVLQIFEFNFS